MTILNEQTKQDLANAVAALERETSGELVCVIATSSANYRLYPLFIAALSALILPVLNYLPGFSPWNDTEVGTFHYAEQTICFLLLALLFVFTPLRFVVTPKAIRIQNAKRLAFEQFFKNNLQHTRDRTGILIFVSLAEHYVEVIADKGINDRLDQNTWHAIVAELAGSIKAKRMKDGLVKAINDCRLILATHFPRKADDSNELHDSIVLIEKSSFLN